MNCLSNYPMGAEDDPFAPWNEDPYEEEDEERSEYGYEDDEE